MANKKVMKCESCKEKIQEYKGSENDFEAKSGCELDAKGSNEWLCQECYERLRLKC